MILDNFISRKYFCSDHIHSDTLMKICLWILYTSQLRKKIKSQGGIKAPYRLSYKEKHLYLFYIIKIIINQDSVTKIIIWVGYILIFSNW